MTTLVLPFPISINAMFSDGRTRRIKSQRYVDWIMEAGWRLKQQKPVPVKGQVTILYEVQDGRDNRRRDIFNLEKGVTDLLVEHGVIEADHDLIVRGGTMVWNRDVEGIRVTIMPAVVTVTA